MNSAILQQKAENILAKITASGVRLVVVGNNSLRVVGSVTNKQMNFIKLWKRQLIDAISPKCSECGLPLELIEGGQLWLCRLGCESQEVLT